MRLASFCRQPMNRLIALLHLLVSRLSPFGAAASDEAAIEKLYQRKIRQESPL